jgi:hypothetical protein
MQKLILTTLLLVTAALAASSAVTGPAELQVPPWQRLQDNLAPTDKSQPGGAGNVIKNKEPDWTLQNPGGTGTPSSFDDPNWQQPARDWGDDILVGEPSYHSSGRISVDDDDATGDVFVCMLHKDATTADTAHIWRSTDGGVTWQQHWPIVGNSGVVGDLNDAQILCGHGPGDTTWLYVVSAASNAGLRIRRSTPDTSKFLWVTIDTATNILRVAVDRNVEDPEHIFCAWENANGQIYAMSSTDAGATWANRVYVSSGRHGVSIAAGGAGYGYVAYMDTLDSTYYRVGRFKNNLVTPNWTFVDVDTGSIRRFREVSIAADRTAPGDSQVAIALATYRRTDNNNIGPRYGWTLDGGTSWSANFWPVTNQSRSTWLARFPRIRRSYGSDLFRAIVSMPETTTTWDTIVYAYARAGDPTNWLERGEYNDNRNTGEVSHDIGYSNLTNGGFIAYRQYGQAKVWFDGYSFTGVSADPLLLQPRRMTVVFGGGANLALARRALVRVSAYDQGGRLVRQIFSGMMDAGQHHLDPGVSGGVHFLRVTIGDQTETAKLVSLR